MKIYHNDTLLLDIEVDDNSYRYRAIKGDHNLTLHFSLAEHVEIPVGATCVFENETYTLESPESLKMEHSRKFEYTVIFDAPQAKAARWKLRNIVDRRLKFTLTATPREQLQMLVDNLNERDGGWTIGRCIEGTEKVLSYNHATCLDALSQMADEWETEYEIVGKQVSLWKVEYNRDNPLPLSYGKGNGFKPGVGRSNFEDAAPVEILYVQGGAQNLDTSKYGSPELLLPRNRTIRFDGVHFEGEAGFDVSKARTYTTDADGFSIRRADKPLSSRAEESLDCSEIYPKRVGTISSVVVVDSAKHFYDIIDEGIPEALDFRDYRIDGETMTILFQSGMLAGKEFEIQQTEQALTGYDHAKRKFEIVPQEIDGRTMPGEAFVPQVGDTYAVFHCMLPAAYICDDATKTGASWEMFREGVKYLHDHEEQKFTFTGELDGTWAKRDWNNIGGRIRLGGFVQFTDERFQREGVLVRIIGIKDYINDPHSPEIELSNSTVGRTVSSELRKIESNEVVVEEKHREALQFTKRRFHDAQQTIGMLKEAMLENFTESISPLSVQAMMMLVGDESLQFRFVDSMTRPAPVPHNVAYDPQKKVLAVPAGIIQHMTLGIATLSSGHAAGEYKFWSLPAFETPTLTDGKKKYYVYAKVSRTARSGVFRISETAIGLETEAGNYHLLLGLLNSEYEGERSYVSLHGFTEVLPGRLTTDRIVSSDGNTYFDLLHGEIGGMIRFTAGSSGLDNLSEWAEKQQQIDQTKEKIDNLQVGGRNLLLDSNIPQERLEYLFATYPLSAPIEAGTTVTLTVWGKLESRVASILLFNSTGSFWSAMLTRSSELADQIKSSGKGSITFPWKIGESGANTSIQLYARTVDNVVEVSTLKRVDRIQLEYGNVSTDWTPAPEDVKQDVDKAQAAADTAAAGVTSLAEFTDAAFADGVVSRAEAASIEKYANAVTETKNAAEAAYKTVYNNSLLGGSAKSNLRSAKEAFDRAADNLLASIRAAAADRIATAAEKADVDAKYTLFTTAHATYTTRLEEATKYIQVSIDTKAQGAYELSEQLQGIVNDLSQTIIPDLQEQIDGSIISWEGAEVPTLANYPASEWTTDTERRRHRGDYYDRFFTLDGQRVTERYKFSYRNNAFEWVHVADSGAAQALAEARDALGLAGTKAKIFFGATTPAAPYAVNDVWFRTTGAGDSMTVAVYISNAERGDAQTPSEADWQLVDDSQVRLRQMSTDSVISREEKAALRNTLAQIETEFASYRQDAGELAIPITDLTAAYDALKNYLTGTVAVGNNTDTLLTPEERNTYNACFASYYTEVSRFTNLVADAIAEEKAARLRESLDAFREEYRAEIPDIRQQLDQKAGTFYQDTDPSLEWATEADQKLHVGDLWYDTVSGLTFRWSHTLKWEEQSVPKEVFDRIDGKNAIHVQKPTVYQARDIWITEADYTLAGVTYPKGTILVATRSNTAFAEGDWAKRDSYTDDTTAQEALMKVADLEYLKGALIKSETVMGGGLVLGQFIGVTSGDPKTTPVVAGLNGSTLGALPTRGKLLIFAGADGIQQIGSAKTRIYEDGTLYSSSARLTDATITGNITATSGKIGDFTIDNGALMFKGEGCGYTDVRMNVSGEGLYITGNVGESGVIAPTNHNCRLIAFSTSASAVIDGKFLCATYSTCARITYRNGNPLSAVSEYRQNVGLAISVTGSRSTAADPSRGNIALLLEDGELMGARHHLRTIQTSSVTLTKYDTDVHANSAIGEINIYLPSAPQQAQEYYIRKLTGSNWLYVRGNGKQILDFNASAPTSYIRWSVSAEFKLKYNADLGYWVASIFYT